MTENNIKAGFSTTGIFPVDELKYKVSRLDKVKLDIYNDRIARGSPLDEDGSPNLPLLQNNQGCVLVNEANCDDSILYTSVNESVLHSESPRKSQRNKLPFSRESHASVLESSIVDNEEPCSSSNRSLKP